MAPHRRSAPRGPATRSPPSAAGRAPESGRLYAEELFGTEGFSGAYSILYHLAVPSQARTIEPLGSAETAAWGVGVQRHHHLRTGGPRLADAQT
jgi:hypothetical protein